MSIFTYKNLISKFFSGGKLASRSGRIAACVEFVDDNIPCKSARSRLAIKKLVSSVDVTFNKKWHDAKGVKERFERENENWLQIELNVRRSQYFSLNASTNDTLRLVKK